MSGLTLQELVSYFFYAQADTERPYQEIDFVRLIEELGLENANRLRHEIVQQLAAGRLLPVIQAELAA
ncbi:MULTISPECIES: hypothetical protein [Deinococcus]|uniref:hypothetical protein n=1 Tax=Deinococcus TaxID=1298 RepID=UPI000051BB6D|nr:MULTISPECIES: hypothetical protein [Deinococcus]MBI0445095.1 hypothetical protein [Deinococcus sp. DB0503]TDE86595.1 hypothetical protein E0686_06320 [Deinococcus sp. S9]